MSDRTLHGVPIRGPLSRLPELIVRFRAGEVLVAIKSLDGNRMLDIVSWCKKSGIPCRTVPSFGSVIDGHVSLRDVRDVAVEDLLGREPVRLDDATVREALRGNCALITGAGGSIGSELARQAAAHGPSRLVLFEMGETPLFEIERELRSRHPNLDIAAVIGDMRHKEVVDRVFQRHRPQHVYHAAAYKHVPLMEEHPDEAVLNNVRGTRHLVEAALRCGVKRFVMISSDKAVRPGNVMGATKRLCELYIEAMNGRGTDFVAVRFGNVLGSSGSVVPIFMKHIATRTPLPVTHPEATRFFMTIPEAARLVLHCGTMNREQGVFVLEMGQPVKIMDLARKMIRLSGLTEGSNIAIEIIGLRPGEKLHEELEAYGENLQKTDVPKINVLRQTRRPVEPAIVTAAVRRIEQMAASHDADNTRRMLMRLVEFDEAMQGKNAPDGSAAPDEESVHRRWEELLMPDGAKCQAWMGKRFLLVDDEASIRMTLRRLLAAMGCEVEIAASREEAFKLLQDNDHDVVLCDLYLPDGSGAEIFAEHSRLGRTSSFVMMTGYNDPQMNAIMGANGDMPLLIKPFGIDQLMTVL